MLKFKEFLYQLQEVLTPEEEQVINSTYPERNSNVQNHLDNHLFFKGIDDIYEPLENSTEKTDTHLAIENHLKQLNNPKQPYLISKEDYKNNKHKDASGRDIKIGKLLNITNAPTHLKDAFKSDVSRQGKNEEGLYVRITRSKTGIAGQASHNQSWSPNSCKNFIYGANRHYLEPEYKHGSVVAYLHNKAGKEIARKTFHPHYDDEGNIMYKEDQNYGLDHQGFNDKAKEIEKRLSSPITDHKKIFRIDPEVYSNKSIDTQLHSGLTDSQLDDIIKDGSHEAELEDLAQTSNRKTVLDKLMKHPSHYVRAAVLQNPISDEDHVALALKDRIKQIKDSALNHPKLSSTNIHDIITNGALLDKYTVSAHKNISPSTIDYIMSNHRDDPNFMKNLALNKKSKKPVLDILMSHDSPIVRESVLSNPNSNEDHARIGFYDNNLAVKTKAIGHKNIDGKLLNRILFDKDTNNFSPRINETLKAEALKSKNILPEDLDHFVYNNSIYHKQVSKNPILNPDHINHLLNSENDAVRTSVIETHGHKFSDEKLKELAANGSRSVKLAANNILKERF